MPSSLIGWHCGASYRVCLKESGCCFAGFHSDAHKEKEVQMPAIVAAAVAVEKVVLGGRDYMYFRWLFMRPLWQ
jgi:hypothetical protein